jgi:hypothetical protein
MCSRGLTPSKPGCSPLDEQPPLVRISWVQARVVVLADTGSEVGHGEHAAVQGVLRMGQVTAGVEAVEELPDRRGVRALLVGLAEIRAAVAGDVDELGDGGRVQAGPLADPAYPGGDHVWQGVAAALDAVSRCAGVTPRTASARSKAFASRVPVRAAWPIAPSPKMASGSSPGGCRSTRIRVSGGLHQGARIAVTVTLSDGRPQPNPLTFCWRSH